jgi:hypothetical protein
MMELIVTGFAEEGNAGVGASRSDLIEGKWEA